jgi:hypothetical protein
MESSEFKLVYVDPYSLLVATRHRKIVRIYCPFTVRVDKQAGKFQKGQDVSVDMVKSDPDGWLIYIIQARLIGMGTSSSFYNGGWFLLSLFPYKDNRKVIFDSLGFTRKLG